ncbi:MAG: YfhO family protein [Chloroflexi bacterium]|nr:YfhO family protein [Chloroflexota bacterium]
MTPGFRARLVDGLLLLLLVLLPQLYFWRLFPSNPTDQKTLVDGDLNQEHFPVIVTVSRALRDGSLPLWNPYSNGGQPLLADPQAALLYPPTWWTLAGVNGFDGDSFLALERQIPLHFSLLGAFSYFLGRVLIGSRFGALLMALTFTYSGFITTYPVQQLPILRSIAWLPLQVLGLWLALERRSWGWAAFGGAMLGMAMLAGHPQTVFQESIVLAVVAAVWMYQNRTVEVDHRRALWAIPALALVGVVAVGLSAIQWIPSLEFMQRSNRAEVSYGFVSGGYAFWELPLDLIAPRVLGGLPVYVGVLPLVLAGTAIALRRGHVSGLAVVLAAVGLILSLGGNSFAYSGAYRVVPGFALFRDQERAIFMFAFGVAILAGCGGALLLGELGRGDWRKLAGVRRVLRVLMLVSVAAGAALYVAHVNAEVAQEGFLRWRAIVNWFFFFVLMLAFSLGLLWMHARLSTARPLIPALAVALVILDLFSVSWDQPLQDRFPNDMFRASQMVSRTLSEIGLQRAVDEGVLDGYHGLIYGIPTINRILAMHLDRFHAATDLLPPARLFDLMNVGYVVTRETKTDGQLLLQEQFEQFNNRLYRRQGALGPAIVVPEARVVSSGSDALAAVAEPTFDPRAQVVLEDTDPAQLQRGGPGRVLSYRRGWNDVDAQVQAPQGGYLLLSEIAYPGWRAEVDGTGTPILVADYLLRALWLPAGDHQVRLSYQPASIRLGAVVTVVTLLGLLVWLGARLVRARASGPSPVATGEGVIIAR